MKYDAIVVGGGPSGCLTAELLAGEGFRVLILEEHEQIGEPVQCAGLISPRTLELAGVPQSIIINRLTGACIFSPLGARLQVNSDRVHALAVDRAAFDQALAVRAQCAGAELLTGAKARGLAHETDGYIVKTQRNGREELFAARLVIGADGANSRVANWLGLSNDNPRAVMYSADVELGRSETSLVEIFLGNNLAPGWFGWVVPLDNQTCRVGAGHAFSGWDRSPRYYFQRIADSFPELFKGMKIIRYTGGTTPLGLAPRIFASHAMLVGDAASQVKPISGGGIYLGLRGAQVCARVAASALREDNLAEKNLARYQQLWEEEFSEEISCGIGHRESFLHFKDQDMESLLRFLNKPYWKKVILNHGDIDYPSQLAKRLFSARPWMKRFFMATLGLASHTMRIKRDLENVLIR
ncbi:MAG: NAD(P)/FAD-dependent oxidoreductase [Firmicutes bacterium]|nr:NAD(P)/FAD-dependent oxidoreductase [Bacillota bacterium]